MHAAAQDYAEVMQMFIICGKVNVNTRCQRWTSALDNVEDGGMTMR